MRRLLLVMALTAPASGVVAAETDQAPAEVAIFAAQVTQIPQDTETPQDTLAPRPPTLFYRR